ncbi:hypothetical protein PsYK624_115830 [Phanerochaete sordida]|uniref:DUF6535 domain-containing protein n=1 Tax=Phanerochaete sordida TaxID=48140 RepID=A0A9P3GJH6_9APHY|nr:hypothetical protein PsYK624_115830 [Phanerochaete sordida]
MATVDAEVDATARSGSSDQGRPQSQEDVVPQIEEITQLHARAPAETSASPQAPLAPPVTAPSHTAEPMSVDSTGLWETLRDTVQRIDLKKVEDARDDLDNVLIFAGLFSAVVTTFVVDSYASLQPDNTDEIVFLMRQSLAQNYTLVDGVLRPMVPFPADLPFQPPLWALRVNGLCNG